MKKTIFFAVVLSIAALFQASALAQAPLPPLPQQIQSIGLPMRVPVYCFTPPDGPATSACTFQAFAGNTGVIISHSDHGGGSFTDSQGNIWTQRFALPFDDDALYDTHFMQSGPDTITIINNQVFPPNYGNFIIILIYEGQWSYVGFNWGSYDTLNSVFSDCRNGNNCPYNWTLPLEADPGDLLIGFSDPESYGPGLAKPGSGYQVEFSNGLLAVEDMIAPIEGAYMGVLTWKNLNGSDSGGSHWVMGLAQYRR